MLMINKSVFVIFSYMEIVLFVDVKVLNYDVMNLGIDYLDIYITNCKLNVDLY